MSSGFRRVDIINVYFVLISFVFDEFIFEYVWRCNLGVNGKVKVVGVRLVRNVGDSIVFWNDDLFFFCVLDFFFWNGYLSFWVGSNVIMGILGIGRI